MCCFDVLMDNLDYFSGMKTKIEYVSSMPPEKCLYSVEYHLVVKGL